MPEMLHPDQYSYYGIAKLWPVDVFQWPGSASVRLILNLFPQVYTDV